MSMRSWMMMGAMAAALSAACANSDDAVPAATPQTAYGQPQQQAYPQTTQTGTYQQPATVAQPAGQMATPGAMALPCQTDSTCILARCNLQYQKCAFPCQSAVDCASGAACNAASGLCLPGATSGQ